MKTNKSIQTLAGGIFLSLTLSILAPQARAQIFVSSNDNTIWEFTAGGVGTLFAANHLNNPRGMAFDNSGRLYVINRGDETIARFDNAGNGTIFAGISQDFSQGLNEPVGVAFDSASDTLYVANRNGNSIEKYSAQGNSFQTGTLFTTNGLNHPFALAINNGKLYVANDVAGTIVSFQLGGDGTATTVASSGLSLPQGLVFDGSGNLYVANQGNNTISKISGGSPAAFATTANGPVGLSFDGAGHLLVAENGQTIEKFTGSSAATFSYGTIQPEFIAYKPECGPAVMTIAQYAGVSITGTIGCTYVINYTTSMNPPVTWTPLVTNTLVSSPFLYIDTNVVSGLRFYEAVTQ